MAKGRAPKKRRAQSARESRDKAREALGAALGADEPMTVDDLRNVAEASRELLRLETVAECGPQAAAEVDRVVGEQMAVLDHLLASDDEFGDFDEFGEMADRARELARRFFRMGSMETYLAVTRDTQTGRRSGVAASNNKKSAEAMRRDAAIRSFYESATGTSGERMRATMQEFPTVRKSTIYAALNRGL